MQLSQTCPHRTLYPTCKAWYTADPTSLRLIPNVPYPIVGIFRPAAIHVFTWKIQTDFPQRILGGLYLTAAVAWTKHLKSCQIAPRRWLVRLLLTRTYLFVRLCPEFTIRSRNLPVGIVTYEEFAGGIAYDIRTLPCLLTLLVSQVPTSTTARNLNRLLLEYTCKLETMRTALADYSPECKFNCCVCDNSIHSSLYSGFSTHS